MTTFLPNLVSVPFGRDNADRIAAIIGADLRKIAGTSQEQYRRIGSDPTQVYYLADGRVVLVRSRQMSALSEIVIFSDDASWRTWRAADGRQETVWQMQPASAPAVEYSALGADQLPTCAECGQSIEDRHDVVYADGLGTLAHTAEYHREINAADDQPELSAGHIAIVNGYEYYAIGGQVYMAPMYAPICDVRTGTRIGRWESSLEHWQRYNTLQRLRDTYERVAVIA